MTTDSNDEVVEGTLPVNNSWTGSVGMNSSIIIPDGAHKNSKVNGPPIPQHGAVSAALNCGQSKIVGAGYTTGINITANSLASQTPGNLAPNKMLAGTYGVSKGVRVDGEIASIGGPSITPQTYGQTIDIAGRYAASNGYVAGVALPPASALKKGYRYWIGDKYVDGTYQGYTDSPLYLYNNGTWGSGAGGYSVLFGDIKSRTKEGRICLYNSNNGGGKMRTTNAIQLTGYKYLKTELIADYNTARVGICDASGIEILSVDHYDGHGEDIFHTESLDISSLSGYYYVFAYFAYDTYNGSGCRTYVNTLYLTAN